MSQRILIEFNTDYYDQWPQGLQRVVLDDTLRDLPNGVTRRWTRHHSDADPVVEYGRTVGVEVEPTS